MTADARPTLLAVDDEPGVLALIERFATGLGFNVVCHTGGRRALALISEIHPDIVIVDLHMPEIDGLDMLRSIRATNPGCAVALMTGQASMASAIEAVRIGALDYLTKPLDLDRLRELLITARKSIERRETLLQIDADVARRFEFYGMIGRSAAMQELFDSIRRLAPHVRTVLITGETGTGKELVARALHKMGPRKDRRFLTVNCSAVVETLFESELFGHAKGAFTGASEAKVGLFEHAEDGTLFLDEVGELPLSLQPKLLRAVEYGEVQRVGSLQTKTVDTRVIAATNRDLRAEVAAGRFRGDLFYRLGVMEIRLPPLRERGDDISLLTAAFVRDVAARMGRDITGVTTAAERALQSAPWEGNVRELHNVVERACLMSDGRILTERDLLAAMNAHGLAPAPPAEAASPGDDRLVTAERDQIVRALQRANGNKSEAARLLGISRRSLYRWLDRLSDGGDAGRADTAPDGGTVA
jgi:two-component system, NtrC family, response regulator HydG